MMSMKLFVFNFKMTLTLLFAEMMKVFFLFCWLEFYEHALFRDTILFPLKIFYFWSLLARYS